MIKERKYSEQNPANAKYHTPLAKIKNAIKKYIQSQPEIYKYYNFSYKSQVHDLDLILDECIKRVKYGNTYRSSIYLPKSTFNKIYLDLHKRNIIKNTYIDLLKLYFKKGANRKLLYRHTDTTCIVNKNGSTKVKYNGYKKRKITKVSLETDANGVAIKITLNFGNMNDAKIFIKDTTKNYLVNKEILEKFKKYYVADSGYYTEQILRYLKENGFVAVIKGNKKNTKDENKLKKFKMTKYQQYIYNKRFIIEDTNANIKSFKLVQTRMDRNCKSFENSLFIALINKVLKYI
jgi:hypothetical protein